jgi:hypothetical protein
VAFYNYQCGKKKPCKVSKLNPELREKLCIVEHPKEMLVWTERHGMQETPEYKCPACGEKAVVSSHGVDVTGFIRGNCYLNRKDAKKQMDIRLLETGNDPYGHMRQPGEVDHIKKTLRGKNKEKKVF